jgi:uncharacterized protein YbaP (TraB family)
MIVFSWSTSCASSPIHEQGASSVWKISKDGNILYLGGSIHILRDSDFPLPKVFDLAFSQAASLVLEANVEEMGNPDVAQYLMSQMYLREDQTLQSLLDLNTYEMLAAKTNEYGFPIDTISNFKPSMIVSMLTMLQIEKYGFTEQGIDLHFLEKTKSANKPVKFLESVQSQINMLVSMGEGYENDFVQYYLEDMENTEVSLKAIVSDWSIGESATTEISLKEMKEKWPIIYRSLITDRHDMWIPQIENYLNSGSIHFVIVGLAHIHGPDGLLRQLEDLGYIVKQFRY